MRVPLETEENEFVKDTKAKQTDSQTNRQIQIDKQTDRRRQTDREMDGQANR